MKLGRALGYGTRHAAKTLAAVAEAATAPDPRQSSEARQTPDPRRAESTRQASAFAAESQRGREAAARPARAVPRVAHVRRASGSFWRPLATFSSALWLRVTGVFFAIIATTMAGGVWRLRGTVHAGADPGTMRHFWLFAGFAVLFGYFTVSSFVRANVRERR